MFTRAVFRSVLVLTVLATCVLAATAQRRTWTDNTGKYKRVATFVQLDGQTVVIERANGKAIRIPLEKLSLADQNYAKAIQRELAAIQGLLQRPEPDKTVPQSAHRHYEEAKHRFQEAQRRCEVALAQHPDSSDAKSLLEFLQNHGPCPACGGAGHRRCSKCTGVPPSRSPSQPGEASDSLFREVTPDELAAFPLRKSPTEGFMDFTLPLGRRPDGLPEGLLRELRKKKLEPLLYDIFRCKKCGYLDMPVLLSYSPGDAALAALMMPPRQPRAIRVEVPQKLSISGNQKEKLNIRTTIRSTPSLRFQDAIDPSEFMLPPVKCPSCGKGAAPTKTPAERQASCNQCKGTGMAACDKCEEGIAELYRRRIVPTILTIRQVGNHSTTFVFLGPARGEFRISDTNGSRRLAVPPGKYEISIEHEGDERTYWRIPAYEVKPHTASNVDPVLAFSIESARKMCQPSTMESHWELARTHGKDRIEEVGR